jgi:mono/diheme cytochrome c family protein
VFKCRSTETGTLPTDDDLRRSIGLGLEGTGMPSFIVLSGRQLDDLVETIKHFSRRFTHEAAGKAIEVPAESENSPASVARGERAYDRMKCANCHGQHGEGGPGAVNLKSENGTLAHVTDFTKPYSLKCGDSPARIYTTLMSGLDGSAMAAYQEVLPPEEAWDLVHYVMSLR